MLCLYYSNFSFAESSDTDCSLDEQVKECDKSVQSSCSASSAACVDADHLHQVFLTKNNVLCQEVQKNFRELTQGGHIASRHLPVVEESLPSRLQDVQQQAFPLFITSRQFLLMLDASCPGDSFFNRKADGSLMRDIEGWEDEEAPIDLNMDFENEDGKCFSFSSTIHSLIHLHFLDTLL